MTAPATKQKIAGYFNALVVACLVNLFLPKYVLADSSYQESPDRVNISELVNNLDCSYQELLNPVNVSDLINDRHTPRQEFSNRVNVFDPINDLDVSCQESPDFINVSDIINAPEQSLLSPPVLKSIGESRELFEQGIQQYKEGQYSNSEHSLKLALSRLNRDNRSRFYLNQLNFSSRLSSKTPQSLDKIYFRLMNSLARSENTAKELIDLGLEQIELISGMLAESISGTPIENSSFIYNTTNLQNSDTKKIDENEINIVEDAHQLEIKILRVLQKTLIAQNQQQKIEEALEIAQLTRHLEQLRVIPAIVHALNGEIRPENQVVDNRLPDLIEPDLLSLGDLKEISQKQDATLVYYSVVSDREIFVWIIQPTGKIDFEEIELTSIDVSLEAFSFALRAAASFVDRGEEDKAALIQDVRQSKPESSYPQNILDKLIDDETQEKVLHELYQKLINPIKKFLPKDPEAHVVFIPQEALLLTPFPALKDATGQYLIEQHTIRIAPNLQALVQNNATLAQFPRNEEILIIGNPANPKFANLPGAELEARVLGVKSASFPLIGSQATSDAVLQRLSDVNVIHLATHGILDESLSPIDVILIQDGSSIARFEGQSRPDATSHQVWYSLWPNNETSKVWHMIRINGSLPGAIALSDDLLTSQEIIDFGINFGLNADLVVLSACNTAQGIPNISNILGLPLSLGIAGVPNVVASLWSVPDKSTEILMSKFYAEMDKQDTEAGEIDIAKALRKAMIEVKNVEEYRDPIHWAGFFLMNVSQ